MKSLPIRAIIPLMYIQSTSMYIFKVVFSEFGGLLSMVVYVTLSRVCTHPRQCDRNGVARSCSRLVQRLPSNVGISQYYVDQSYTGSGGSDPMATATKRSHKRLG